MHTATTSSLVPFWPVIIYGGLVALVVAGMIGLSYVLGERHSTLSRNRPYESGIEPTGSARLRYGAKYYLVGIFFILFDVEAAVIFAWAVAFREVGWAGYIEVALFIGALAAGLVYVWKLRGLDVAVPTRGTTGGDGE
jgi:NADH-quinone oxidoreductase subunit A